MNEEAKQVLAEMMQRTLDGVDAAVEFGKAEIPVVVEQLLMWHMVESLVFFVASLAFLASTPLIVKQGRKIAKAEIDSTGDAGFTCIFGGGALAALSFVMLLSAAHNLDWLKIWIAPKLYLLEYGAELVK